VSFDVLTPSLISSTVALLANAEQHRGRAQLDDHLPDADEHSRSLHGQQRPQERA